MTPSEVRSRLLVALEADLIGPFALGSPNVTAARAHASDEVLPMPPSRWYFTGFLAPRTQRAPEKDDLDSHGGDFAAGSESQAEDAGATEPEPARPIRFPASMGLSVYLPKAPAVGTDSIEVELSYADYEPVEIAEDTEDKRKVGWQRVARGPLRFSLALDEKSLAEYVDVPGARGLKMVGELRETSMEGLGEQARVLSLWVVNDRLASDKERDRAFVFQMRMSLQFARGFKSRPNRRGEDAETDDDPRVLALVFRDKKEWAVGHNVAYGGSADGRRW